MIGVRCLGHIGTSVGAKDVALDVADIGAEELVEMMRARSGQEDPGFTKYNTLVLVEDGEAFVPAASGRRLKAGEKVVLIPFSHGG
jgi:molybdopterin converting factor small subunit